MRKTCTKCGETKQLEDFYQQPDCKDGRQGSCKACDNVRTKAWKAAHPESERATNRKRYLRVTYGITPEQYDDLLEAQRGRCACCGTDEPGGRRRNTFHVDHDHKTGRVRGLLCHSCNIGIGALGDTLEGVERAAAYLRLAPLA